MNAHSFPEKRRSPRVDNNVPLKISTPDTDLVTETRNISGSGAYCRVNKYLEPMSKLQITLMLPVKSSGKLVTKKVNCGGVVVRTENVPGEDGFNTAIFFNDIHPRDSRTLNTFVQNLMVLKVAEPQNSQH